MAPTTRSSKPKKSPGSKQKKKQKQRESESTKEEIEYTDDKSDILSDDSLGSDWDLEELAQQAAEVMTAGHHAELSGSTPGSKCDSDPEEEESDSEVVLPFVVDVDSNINSKINISTSHATDTMSRHLKEISDDKNVEKNNEEGFLSLKQATQQRKEEDEEEVFISLESGQDDNTKTSLKFEGKVQTKSKQFGNKKSVQRNKE